MATSIDRKNIIDMAKVMRKMRFWWNGQKMRDFRQALIQALAAPAS